MQRRPEFARIRTCLASSVHFRSLSSAQLDRIAALGRLVKLDGGRLLSETGAAPNSFWIVLSGGLRITSSGEDGDEFVYALLGAGSFFGLGYILIGEPFSLNVTARAYGATELATIDGAAFVALADQTPGLWRHVCKLMLVRLSVAMNALRDVTSAKLSERIVRRLVGQALSSGVDPRAETKVDLRVTQSDLAVMLGASRSKVNGELKRLEAQGLIAVGYRSIALRDLGRLRTLAGPNTFAL